MPSLSLLIGATSAITVILVAAVTLSITLTASLDAIEKLGLDETKTLSELALTKLDNYVERPRNAVLTVNSHTMGGYVPNPSADDPTDATVNELAAVMRGAWRTAESASTVAAIMKDGTFIITQRNPRSPGLHMLQAVNTIRNGGIVLRTESTFIGNGSDSPAALLVGAATPSTFSVLFNQGNFFWFMSTQIFVDENKLNAWIPNPIILQFGAAPPFLQLSLHAAAYNGSDHQLGILASGVTADAMSRFLLESQLSSGTHLFAVGPDARIIATTHPSDWYTIEANVPRNRTTLLPGCSSTITSTAAAPGAPVHWVCRQLLAEHAFAPVKELMSSVPEGSIPELGVRKIKLDGENYFVSVSSSQITRTFGYLLNLITLIPEEDITGAVGRAQAIAIGVSVAVLIIAVGVSCLIVVMLLRPLEGVAVRMAYAAALEDDDAARDLSAISEVRQLQESFYELSDELKRVRSFVPATVLAGKFEAEDEEEGDLDYSGSVVTSERRGSEVESNRSRHTQNTGLTRKSGAAKSSGKRTGTGSASGGGGALNVVAGLTERIVTVAMADCEGFHDVVRKETVRQVARVYHSFIDAVSTAVLEGHGVLDSFHGDRLMMTFNGARPIAMHTRRGVMAALSVATVAVPATLKLRAHIGISSGRCRVGNVGGTSAMRFCILGSPVTRAAALCSLGRTYADEVLPADPKRVAQGAQPVPTGSTILVSGMVAHDTETNFVTQPVDYTCVKRGSAPELVAAVLGPVSEAANNDEWMYVLEKAAQTGGPAAKAGLGLRKLQEGDVPRAKELLATAQAELGTAQEGAASVGRLRAAIASIDTKGESAPSTTATVAAAVLPSAGGAPMMPSMPDLDEAKIFKLIHDGDVDGAKAAFAALPGPRHVAPWARSLAVMFASSEGAAVPPPGAVPEEEGQH